MIIGFVLQLFFIRHCAYSGSKRVIGGFDGLMLGMLLGVFGILIVLSSSKLSTLKPVIPIAETER